jgi:hypothetical protein
VVKEYEMDASHGGVGYGEDSDAEAAHVSAMLPSYATAMVLGEAAPARFPQIARHLERCAACRTELAELLSLLEPLYDGTLTPVADSLSLDLSFLGAPEPIAAPDQPSRNRPADALKQFVVVLDQQLEALRRRWSGALERPSLLQTRGAPAVQYEPDPSTTGGVNVLIQIYASHGDAQRCDLQVALLLPEGMQVPSATTLTLHVDEQVWHEHADADGQCVFPAKVPVAARALRLEATFLD